MQVRRTSYTHIGNIKARILEILDGRGGETLTIGSFMIKKQCERRDYA